MHLAVADRLRTGRCSRLIGHQTHQAVAGVNQDHHQSNAEGHQQEMNHHVPKILTTKLPPNCRKSFIKGGIAHGLHSVPAHQGIGRLLASGVGTTTFCLMLRQCLENTTLQEKKVHCT